MARKVMSHSCSPVATPEQLGRESAVVVEVEYDRGKARLERRVYRRRCRSSELARSCNSLTEELVIFRTSLGLDSDYELDLRLLAMLEIR